MANAAENGRDALIRMSVGPVNLASTGDILSATQVKAHGGDSSSYVWAGNDADVTLL